MATPLIQSVGSVSGAGTVGQGRSDLVPGEQVELSDAEPTNAGALYLWEFEDVPIGTTPEIIDPTTATPHFIVDGDAGLAGSYRVKVTVNGIDRAIEVYGVPLATTGARIPSFQEEGQYDGGSNAKGWHEALTTFMREVDARLPATGSSTTFEIWCGGRESHNSDTPLVVGGFAFTPADFAAPGTVVTYEFVVVAANGSTPLVSHASLFNVTTNTDVTYSTVTIESTEVAAYTGGIGLVAGIYECRIFLEEPPADPLADTIELYKAAIKVTVTIGTGGGGGGPQQ